ncbi:hypothetical protein L7F22_056752 [Adiantum nelumboides]|nr:hypothetical protein [Adiantum nelumboides]
MTRAVRRSVEGGVGEGTGAGEAEAKRARRRVGNMGTTLKFSSSFHPQTDGQSEEANSIVLDLLKCYVSKHKAKWEQYLPLVEYAYNNIVHSSTGKAAFEIVGGGKKVPPILHTKDKTFETDKYVQDVDEMYKKVKVALEKTRAKQKKAVDRHRREVVFSLGDWVLLHFEKARLKKMKGKEILFPKLSMRYYGPFQACDRISDVAYRLKLPKNWKIHSWLVFRFGERQQAFKLQCDVCGSSIGAVLLQDEHAIAYKSKVLRGPENHMQIYEELLAVIHALESWKHYLLGADYTVHTNHQSLRYFLTRAKLFEKHLSWANFSSMFHFQLVHVAGKKNVVADALSRRPHVAAVSIAYQHELDEMRDQYSTDEDFAKPYDALIRGKHPDSFSL